MSLKKTMYLGFMLIIGVVSFAAADTQGEMNNRNNTLVEKSPNALLYVPKDNFRKEWTLLGSYSVLAEDPEKGAKELHVVYAKPEVVDAYRESSAFPDGAILVKEVFAAQKSLWRQAPRAALAPWWDVSSW